MTDVTPVALYVHWPYCARICPYCDFNVVRDRGRREEQAALAAALVADIAEQAARMGPRRLVSIFFGGGTPSLMAPDQVAAVVEAARAGFTPEPGLEITLEANPTDAEAGRFAALAEAGVQRLSLGVQALDDDALRFLGRNHGAAEARRAAQAARAVFARLSIDMIYARPGQTPKAWAAELEQALVLGPEHVSPYQLTIEAGTAFGRAWERGTLRPPDDDAAAALFDTTQDVLGAAGFEAYEVSNHARGAAARSAHNLAVWRGAEYVGVGPGAHGRVVLDGVRTATEGRRKVGDYIAAVAATGVGFAAEPLTPVEEAQERLMLGLRIAKGVETEAFAALGLASGDPRVADLVAAGLLDWRGGRVAATPRGRLVLDAVLKALLT